MVKIRINGMVYEDPNIIQIKGGCLIVGEKNHGVIGYECCVKTLEGTMNMIKEDATITWTPNEN
jgi:hypothetical protein